MGRSRFDQLHTDLGISRKVLTRRLTDLINSGIITRSKYQDNPPRHDYTLTDRGQDLLPVLPVLPVLVAWGDRWEPTDGGPPMSFVHASRRHSTIQTCCRTCGNPVRANEIAVTPGPDGRSAPGTALIGDFLTGPR